MNRSGKGKLSCLYLTFADYDLTQTDAAILADAAWANKLCVMEAEDDVQNAMHNIEDTCTGDEEVSIFKSQKRTIKGELYIFRIYGGVAADLIKQIDTAAEPVDGVLPIVGVLNLSSKRDSADARGSIGNYTISKKTEKSSASDLIKLSIEFEPAGLSTFGPPFTRKIYAY